MKISKNFQIPSMILIAVLSPFIINILYGLTLKYVPGTMYVENTDTWLLYIGTLVGSFIAIWGVWWQVIYTEKIRKKENVLKYIEIFFRSILGGQELLKKTICNSQTLIGFALIESPLPKYLKLIEPMNQKFIDDNISTIIELENIGEKILELNKNINLSNDLFDEIKKNNKKQKKAKDIMFFIHSERLKQKGVTKDLLNLKNKVTTENFEKLLGKTNIITSKGLNKLYELDIERFKEEADIMSKINFFHNIIYSHCITGKNEKDKLEILKKIGINLELISGERSFKNSIEIFKIYFKLLDKAFKEYSPEVKEEEDKEIINEISDFIKKYGAGYIYSSSRAYKLVDEILKEI